jgi:tRNA pseudouridine32 synthase/23S rRNA pseudouridine746 synthase
MPQILYQDEFLVVLDKPHGLLSVPGRGEDKFDSVATRIQAQIPEARVVHRLDCATSGVMLMAVGIEAQRELNRQFREGEVTKEYMAVVHGTVSKVQGVIEIPIRGNPDDRPRQIIDYQLGKHAVTEWTVTSAENNRTRLLLKPVTGRTHQLRVHCMGMGFPIVGDRLYNPEEDVRAERMLLHAETIGFSHPVSGKRMRMRADCEF